MLFRRSVNRRGRTDLRPVAPAPSSGAPSNSAAARGAGCLYGYDHPQARGRRAPPLARCRPAATRRAPTPRGRAHPLPPLRPWPARRSTGVAARPGSCQALNTPGSGTTFGYNCPQACFLAGARCPTSWRCRGRGRNLGSLFFPVYRAEQSRMVAAIRAALSEETFAAGRAEGLVMTLEQAIAYALDPAAPDP